MCAKRSILRRKTRIHTPEDQEWKNEKGFQTNKQNKLPKTSKQTNRRRLAARTTRMTAGCVFWMRGPPRTSVLYTSPPLGGVESFCGSLCAARQPQKCLGTGYILPSPRHRLTPVPKTTTPSAPKALSLLSFLARNQTEHDPLIIIIKWNECYFLFGLGRKAATAALFGHTYIHTYTRPCRLTHKHTTPNAIPTTFLFVVVVHCYHPLSSSSTRLYCVRPLCRVRQRIPTRPFRSSFTLVSSPRRFPEATTVAFALVSFELGLLSRPVSRKQEICTCSFVFHGIGTRVCLLKEEV